MQRNVFFELEEDKQILDLKNKDGAPLWLFMRNSLFSVVSTTLFHDAAVATVRPFHSDMPKYLLKALWHNFRMFFKRKKVSVVFYTISREVLLDQKFFNQYTDDYAALIPDDSITIEHPPLDWKWKFPRHNNNLIFSGPWLALCSAWAKLSKQDSKAVHQLLAFAEERLTKICGLTLTDHQRQTIINETIYQMAQTKVYAKWLAGTVKRYGAKCIVMLGGSYPWYYYLNKEFKDKHILCADLQHGWISATNYVYNYAQSLVDHEDVVTAAPDYYLCYGSYWAEKSNIPHRSKISLGNPYRSNIIRNFSKREGNKIVLIGCARNTKGYLEMAQYLSEIFPNAEVLFRPHPTERYETEQMITSGEFNCKVDMGGDLYTLLSETQVLISEISTVLFESIGLVDNIFVWQTEFSSHVFPDKLFATFTSKEELVELIRGKTDYEVDANAIWDAEWKENFLTFYRDIVLKNDKI